MEVTKYGGAAVLEAPRAMTRKELAPVFPKDTPTQSKMAMCPGCDEPFEVRRDGHIYCSQRCYQRVRRRKLRNGRLPGKPGVKPGYKQSPEHARKTSAKPGAAHHNWKGAAISEKGGRGRALHMYPDIGPCQRCGAEDAERHHRDGNTANNTPSNIRILCRRCHMLEDGRLFKMREVRAAVKNPHRGRFSDDDIREMFRLRDEGLSQSQIAKRFGVQQPYISRVLSGIRRGDVTIEGEN